GLFSDSQPGGLRDALIRISGAADFEQRFQALPFGRGETVAYSRDLDGDGIADHVLENQRVRGSFSGADGRWMEWVWKDSNTNLLPDAGAFPASALTSARASGASWEFRWKKGRRTVTLGADNRLTIEQDQALPAEILKPEKKDGVTSTIERATPNRAEYSI